MSKLGLGVAVGATNGSSQYMESQDEDDVSINQYSMQFLGQINHDQVLYVADNTMFDHQVSGSSNKSKFSISFWYNAHAVGSCNMVFWRGKVAATGGSFTDESHGTDSEFYIRLERKSGTVTNGTHQIVVRTCGIHDKRINGDGDAFIDNIADGQKKAFTEWEFFLEDRADSRLDNMHFMPGITDGYSNPPWYNITITYDGSQTFVDGNLEDERFISNRMKMYVNGIHYPYCSWNKFYDEDDNRHHTVTGGSAFAVADAPHTLNAVSQPLVIGAASNAVTGSTPEVVYEFNGHLDEIGWWKQAVLTAGTPASEVTAIYNSGTPGKLTALGQTPDGYWRMEGYADLDSSGTADNIANGYAYDSTTAGYAKANCNAGAGGAIPTLEPLVSVGRGNYRTGVNKTDQQAASATIFVGDSHTEATE